MAERLGALTGESAAAGRFVAGLRERLSRVASVVSRADRRPTLVVELRYPNLLTAGAESMAADAAAPAGGRLVPETGGKVARLGEEELCGSTDNYLGGAGPKNPDRAVSDGPLTGACGGSAGRVAGVVRGEAQRPGPERWPGWRAAPGGCIRAFFRRRAGRSGREVRP